MFGNVGAPYLFCISFREMVVIQRVVLPINYGNRDGWKLKIRSLCG